MMGTQMLTALNERLIKAHRDNDAAQMADLYQQAAKAFDLRGDLQSAAFYYTQAYILALEAGSPNAQETGRWLTDHGRL